jgi:hypothetical protein
MLIIIHRRSHEYPTLLDHGVSLDPLPLFVKITFRLIGDRLNPPLAHPTLFQAFWLRHLVLLLSPSFRLFWTLGGLSAVLAPNASAPPNIFSISSSSLSFIRGHAYSSPDAPTDELGMLRLYTQKNKRDMTAKCRETLGYKREKLYW